MLAAIVALVFYRFRVVYDAFGRGRGRYFGFGSAIWTIAACLVALPGFSLSPGSPSPIGR
jgi:hypothetical protein